MSARDMRMNSRGSKSIFVICDHHGRPFYNPVSAEVRSYRYRENAKNACTRSDEQAIEFVPRKVAAKKKERNR